MLLATGSSLTPIIVAVLGALGAAIGGSLLVAGPQRRNITAEAAERAIGSIDKVRESLEARLAAVENELGEARTRIRSLERELELAETKSRAAVAELERERQRLMLRVDELERQVHDFHRRLPTEPAPTGKPRARRPKKSEEKPEGA